MLNYVRRFLQLNANDPHSQEVLKGASVAFVLKVLAAALQFVFSVIIARSLGASGAGVFFLTLTVVIVCSTTGRVGLDNLVLKNTAIHAVNHEWGHVKGLYRKTISIVFGFSATLSMLLWFFAPLLADQVFSEPGLVISLRWMSLSIVPHALLWIHAEFLKGLKRISFSLFVQSVSLPLFALLFIPVCALLLGPSGAILAYICSTLITLCLGYTLLRRSVGDWGDLPPILPDYSISKPCRALYLIAIMNLIISWGSTILLGVFCDSRDVGIFSAAQRTSALTSFVLIAVNSVAAPKFAAFYNQNDISGLEKTFNNATKLMVFAAGPVLLLFLVVPENIMTIFGNDFRAGGLLLSILAIGQFVNVVTGSVGYILMMSGNEGPLRNNFIFSAVLNLVLCTIFIPLYGAIGAAIVMAFTFSQQNLVSAYLVNKYVGMPVLWWK